MRSDSRYSGDLIDTEDFGRQKIEVRARFAELFRDQPYQDVGVRSLLFERESNGMPTLDTAPRDSPAWQRRIEKARREIAAHKDHIEWQEQVATAHRVWKSDDIAGLIEFIKGQYR